MNKVIVYTNPDGSCAVIHPSPDSGLSIEEIFKKDVPANAINPRITDIKNLPNDRLFRNAWDDGNPEEYIGLNISKAKVVAHDMRRAYRQSKLSPLDAEAGFMSTTPERLSAINNQKKAILDKSAILQVQIDNAKDEAELRTALNDGLSNGS